jgi:outer membrane protein TolC
LNSLRDRPFLTPVTPAEALAEQEIVGTLESWQMTADARPELLAARAELAARQAGVKIARAGAYPNFMLTGTHAHFDEWPGNSIRFGIAFPLWDHGTLRARRDEAQALAVEQEAVVADLKRQTRLDIQVAYNQAVRAAARMQRYRTDQLEQARMLADLARIGYEAGQTNYLELLDAQNTLQQTQAGYRQAIVTTARARLTLERAAGSRNLLPAGEPGGRNR